MLKWSDLAKNFGVCNFSSKQMCRLIRETGYTPKICQVECHLLLQQAPLLEFCQAKNIQLQAYAPLGEAKVQINGTHILEISELKTIAEKHGVSTAQVIDRMLILITKKSSNLIPFS